MAVPDETRRSLDRDADGFCRAFESPAPVLSKTSEAPVVAVHDDGTIDVGYGGAVLTVKMTTACAGVAVGDTVLLTAYGQMLYATGVLARDNGHYVRLWEGSWGSGSITVPGASECSEFVITFSNQDENAWIAPPCIANERGADGSFSLRSTFFGLAASSTVVFIAALLKVSGDVIDMTYMTKAFVSVASAPFSVVGTQEARIVTIRAI